jgi:hypothetical protein
MVKSRSGGPLLGFKSLKTAKPDIRFPTWLNLISLWIETNYDQNCLVVFANPLAHVEEMKKHFGARLMGSVINSEYAILICSDAETANKICNATPESKPYTMVFIKGKLTNENT